MTQDKVENRFVYAYRTATTDKERDAIFKSAVNSGSGAEIAEFNRFLTEFLFDKEIERVNSKYPPKAREAKVVRLLAVDPGLRGALVFCDYRKHGEKGYTIERTRVFDMPTTTLIDKKNLPCPHRISSLIKEQGGVDVAITEKLGPFPRSRRDTEWRLSMGYGVLLSCISQETETDSLHLVAPSAWKRKMSVTADKSTSIALANSLATGTGLSFTPSQDGRAEAYLLAHYYARNLA